MSEQQVLPELIATLKAAAEKATPGARYVDGECVRNSESIIILATRHRTPKAQWANDAALIAAASPENILKLLTSLAQSEAERERLQGELTESHELFKATFGLATENANRLAREREANQGLRLLVKEYRDELEKVADSYIRHQGFYVDEDRELELRKKADALLEPKSAPVATTS